MVDVPARENGSNENCEQGCEGKSSRKSRVEVVEEGFLHISARGYI